MARMVRTLPSELGTDHGTVTRVATQLGYGVESVCQWVRQADIDDGQVDAAGSSESARIKQLEQENRELGRAVEVLKRASAFFGAEFDRHPRGQYVMPNDGRHCGDCGTTTTGSTGTAHCGRRPGVPEWTSGGIRSPGLGSAVFGRCTAVTVSGQPPPDTGSIPRVNRRYPRHQLGGPMLTDPHVHPDDGGNILLPQNPANLFRGSTRLG